MIKAIVFTSKTGHTAEYAKILGEKIGLPYFSLPEAKKKLAENSEIIYLGWLMASRIKGYKQANKMFDIKAVCGVGMSGTGEHIDEVNAANALPGALPVFTLQGGLNMNKLSGMNKFMMKIMNKVISEQLEKNDNRTAAEDATLDMIKNGASYVSEENLAAVLKWYQSMQ